MITYLEAIREAQARALADDPRVYIYGQDVGAFGGAFKATKNLAQEFPGRVLDSPTIASSLIGESSTRPGNSCASVFVALNAPPNAPTS